jgi:hypothetical protein
VTLALGVLLVALTGAVSGRAADVVWSQNFETDAFWDQWHVEGGVWAVGRPTAGPATSHPPGLRCAGTVLNGNYPASADARLVRDEPFLVPPASEYPRLRFWHWNSNYPEDPCTVEIQPVGGGWVPISPTYVWDSSAWTRTTLDLREFAGQRVILSFRFRSNADAKVAAGWYVDHVELVTGKPTSPLEVPNNPERFESELGDWNVVFGAWEVGVPPASRGPGRAYSGTRCAGTILNGNYNPAAAARLISPAFVVPSANQYPRLRFWHWNDNRPQDPCFVEIRVGEGAWQGLSSTYVYTSRVWTRATLDLRAFADQTVQIAFRLGANNDADVGSGWYVDDVEVATGKPVLREFEDFEQGLGDWSAERGGWEVGVHPTNLGPGRAVSGSRCAGTVLGGNYDPSIDSRLISPEFEVPPAEEHPRLRFVHWNNNYVEDPGVVEIRPLDGTWQPISPTYVRDSRVWTRSTLDLRAYAGQVVQVAFRFKANTDGNVAAGWYIDNVELVRGRVDFDPVNQPWRFSSGLGDWEVERGDWQVGVPRGGPGKAYSPPLCAGTVLDGNYDVAIDTRIISPEFRVPAAAEHPRLRFYHWYSTAQGDVGTVQIRTPATGWQIISPAYVLANRTWTRATVDLTAYAEQTVQIGFHFRANTDGSVDAGWYVDDFEVVTGRTDFCLVNNPEGFEAGLGDWEVAPGNWQVGKPTNGPPAAFKGLGCAGTVLDSTYDPNIDTRLISPPFIVPCLEAAPRLRYAHWYGLGGGDWAALEIREVPGSAWLVVGDTFRGTGGDWSTGFLDLAAFAGKPVQLAFRLRGNGDGSVGPGWFVDEVRIQANVADPLPDRRVTEGELLSFSLASACRDVKFRLGSDAPPGLEVDPDFGILTWLPDACQGPGVYAVSIVLADPVLDLPLAVLTNRIEVLDVNPPPIFGTVPPLAIQPGVPVPFRASDHVFDPSCPVQQLTYGLEPGSPAGATIDPRTGELRWTPTAEQASRVNQLNLRVTDNGNPPLSATAQVLALPMVRLTNPTLADGQLRLTVEGGSPGMRCALLAAAQVTTPLSEWAVIEELVLPAEGPTVFAVARGTESARFFRLRLSAP